MWARGAYAVLALALMAAAGTSWFGLSGSLPGAAPPPKPQQAYSAAALAAYTDAEASAPAQEAPEVSTVPTDPPSPSATPEATASPEAAPETPATATPAATPQPSVTAAPTTTPQPSDSAAPAATLQPSATASPEATPKPPVKPDPKGSTMFLRVYKGSQCVVAICEKDGQGWAERVMICSTGRRSDFTPNGTYKISDKYAYHQLEGAMGQYCSRFNGGILFHSVPIDNSAKKQARGRSRMIVRYYNQLGKPASLGCVRLLVRDALWIYKNCPAGTRVEVVSEKSPYGGASKPALKSGWPYTSGGYGWDPTDPDPKNPYLKN